MVEPQEAELLRREVFERVHDLDRLAQAERVKSKVRRTVYRVGLSDGRRMVVKRFRARSWRDRFKERFIRSKAEAEWLTSRRLSARGLPTSRAVAWGRPVDASGEVRGYLVIDAPLDVLGANRFLDALGPSQDPRVTEDKLRFTRELAGFVRRLHDAGVRHHDLHAGNILVRREQTRRDDRFLLIDLQGARIGRPPGARHRARALAQLLNTYASAEAIRPQAHAAFVEAYHEAGARLASRRLRWPQVERLVERQRARRLASRSRRCLMNSSKFAVERVGRWRVYHRRDHTVSQVLALVEGDAGTGAALGAAAQGVTVRRVRPAHGGGVVQVKVYPSPRGLGRLVHAFVGSPGVQEYAAAHRRRLEAGGWPRPIAAVECLRGAGRGGSASVLEIEEPGR